MDSWWYPWQLSCFTFQPTATILAIKIRWNIELYDRNSSTTLVWRYGFWKAVHTGLWSWQPGCHHTNYEQNWSSLTYISIFWLHSGVFFEFFLAKRNFQRLYSTHYSRTATTWLTLPFRPCALLSESPSFVPVPICGAEQQQLEKNVCNICVMKHYLASVRFTHDVLWIVLLLE